MVHNYEIKKASCGVEPVPFFPNEKALKISFETVLVRAFGRLVVSGFCFLVLFVDV